MATTTPSRTRLVRWAAALLLVTAGVIHLLLVPEYLAEAPVIGVLFVLAVPATVLPAVGIVRGGGRTAWLLGSLVSAGMIVGFVLSRTVGLLGYWSEDVAEGIPALAVEGVFLLLAATQVSRLARTPAAAAGRLSRSPTVP